MYDLGHRKAWIERARAVPIMDELTRRGIKLRRVGAEHVGPCPKCGGTDRFSVNPKKLVWNCRGCSTGGDVIDLVQHLDGGTFDDNVTTLAGKNNVTTLTKKTNGKTSGNGNGGHVTEHPYRDEAGEVVHVVVRTNIDGQKAIKQRRPDPNNPKRWLNTTKGRRPDPPPG
jgi:DNA primase